MMNKAKDIQLVSLKEIKLNPKNRNKHPAEQIDRLVEIMKYQGFRNPVTVSNRSGLLIAGEGRLLAAKKLKMEKIPVIFQDFDSEEQEYAYGISDNAIASWAELDLPSINSDLPDLGPDFDIDMLGLRNFELDPADKYDAETEDDVPPPPIEATTKRGDIWLLGNHRLVCGDSTMIDDVERLMAGEKADMVFTDPPYNHAGKEKLVSQSVSQAMKKLSESEWDKNFSFKETAAIIEIVKAENCTVYVCTSWHLAGEIWEWMKCSNHYSYCIWNKPNPMPSLMKRHWTWSTEIICYATFGKHIFNFPESGHASNVWTIQKNANNDLHPTMKPIAIPEMAIVHSSNQGQSILDLFGGSGSTLIACEKTNRKCFMMEIDPVYCDVIVARWEKFTGQKAALHDQRSDSP